MTAADTPRDLARRGPRTAPDLQDAQTRPQRQRVDECSEAR
jgi:hypothetical protein